MATPQKSWMQEPHSSHTWAFCTNRFSAFHAGFKKRAAISLAAIIFPLALSIPTARASTTIDPANRFAYGANIGWIDWRGDTNNGAIIGAYACSGYVYAANVGWINLGSGNPTNGRAYQNRSTKPYWRIDFFSVG
jgi:hypothetical protein